MDKAGEMMGIPNAMEFLSARLRLRSTRTGPKLAYVTLTDSQAFPRSDEGLQDVLPRNVLSLSDGYSRSFRFRLRPYCVFLAHSFLLVWPSSLVVLGTSRRSPSLEYPEQPRGSKLFRE